METLTLEKEVESQTLVRFPDCDPFNHLNKLFNQRNQAFEYYKSYRKKFCTNQ